MTPEQLWEKHLHNYMYATKARFLAALAEYGEAVRAEAVSVLQVKSIKLTESGCKNLATATAAAATAIEKMKLP
jgi:hypothetical protein